MELAALPSDSLLNGSQLQHPFSCAPAERQHLVLSASAPDAGPSRSRVEWGDIAIGMMVGRNGRISGHLEAKHLQSASETWVAMIGASLGLIILADCAASDQAGMPPWMHIPPGAAVVWQCYRGLSRPGLTLWRKTRALLRELDQSSELGRRRFYLKVDVDTAPALSQRFQVQAVPTLLLMDGGRVLARKSGAAPVAGGCA